MYALGWGPVASVMAVSYLKGKKMKQLDDDKNKYQKSARYI